MVNYPSDWEIVTISDIYIIKRGQVLATTQIRNQKSSLFCYPVYSSQTLNNGLMGYYNQYNFEDAITWTTDGANAGTTRYRVGKFYCTNICGVLSSSEGYANRCMAEIINRETPKHVSYVGNPKLMSNVISKIKIPLPPLAEQKAIADTLSTFDMHIKNLSELIEKKKAVRDGALDDLMSGRTRLKGFSGEWEVKKLLDCVNLIQGLTYTPNNISSYGTLVLRASNIQNNSLSFNDNVYVNMQISQEKMVHNGDILVCVRNGSSDLIGKSCKLPTLPNTTFGAFMSILRGDKTGYIAKIFNSNIIQKQVRNRTSATINQITKKDFENILIPLPSLHEQKAISDTLTALDNEIKALEDERDKIIQVRDGAMNDLLTGRIRLKVS